MTEPRTQSDQTAQPQEQHHEYELICRTCGARGLYDDRLAAARSARPSDGLREAVRLFFEDHDGDDHTDTTWPCDGQCVQARALRVALEATGEGHVHNFQRGYGVAPYCHDCGIEESATGEGSGT